MTPSPQPQRPTPPADYPDSAYRPPSGFFLYPLSVLVALLIGFGVVLIVGFYWHSSRTVTVIIDGSQQQVRTHQTTITGLLDEIPITLVSQDTISPPRDTTIRDGMIVKIAKAYPILILADGHTQRLVTARLQPRDILMDAGIRVGPHDSIRVDGNDLKPGQAADQYTNAPSNIVVVRALKLILDDNGQLSELYTAARTVGEALHDANLTLYLADSITPDPSAPLTDGDTITLRRSVPITILVDSHQLATRTHAQTVGAALAETGIALVGLDYVMPDETATLQTGMTIRVVRVSEEQQVTRSLIDFQQINQDDPSLATGTQKIIQPGIQGIREETITIRREDGIEVSRTAPITVILQAPQDEVTAIGTLPAATLTASSAK